MGFLQTGPHALLSDPHSPVHLNSGLVLLPELVLVLIQLVQRHVLVGFDCLEEKPSRQRMRVQDKYDNRNRRDRRETRQSVLPIDCCLRTCSSSSSSLGSSLGGRMPFLLRMSFHSVSAFGSLGKKTRNHGTFVCLWLSCAVLGFFSVDLSSSKGSS